MKAVIIIILIHNLNIIPNTTSCKNLNVELRSKDKFAIPFCKNNIGQNLLNYRGITIYNNLVNALTNINPFKESYKLKVYVKDYCLQQPP
jgi:hypothetical protein